MRTLLTGALAVLAGGVAAGVTVVSLVNGSTGAPSQSPGDATQPQLVQYGTVDN